MKPVFQSKLYIHDASHNGNCYAACVASLLELPLWMVPPFEEMFARGGWFERSQEWLIRFHGLKLVRSEGHDVQNLPEFYIANGPSPRGVHHATIFSGGVLVHDPYPSGAGIADVEWTWHLAPV